jgi:hypothetical protein
MEKTYLCIADVRCVRWSLESHNSWFDTAPTGVVKVTIKIHPCYTTVVDFFR